MVILGIDPGIGRAGWGIVETKGSQITIIDFGCIETPANSELVSRLLTLHKELDKIIDEYKPEAMAVEDLFLIPMPKLH